MKGRPRASRGRQHQARPKQMVRVTSQPGLCLAFAQRKLLLRRGRAHQSQHELRLLALIVPGRDVLGETPVAAVDRLTHCIYDVVLVHRTITSKWPEPPAAGS